MHTLLCSKKTIAVEIDFLQVGTLALCTRKGVFTHVISNLVFPPKRKKSLELSLVHQHGRRSIVWEHQHGRRSIVWEHQHGGRDVT